tara:strand:- start:7346 stop:7525 length:180 start_codon:yes stop_codon:yes gene_type:complete
MGIVKLFVVLMFFSFVFVKGVEVIGRSDNSYRVPVQGNDDRTVEQKWKDAKEWAVGKND